MKTSIDLDERIRIVVRSYAVISFYGKAFNGPQQAERPGTHSCQVFADLISILAGLAKGRQQH